ncbi:collagen-like triple helix repeat-containing protein [Bizionia myxarmorum]|uniref:Collagen-like protein n=1 Tax=Bizionia myxarmorum TaxID=291186 RepID=A0A5D0R696_9FLAO|nr:collagen-like protein [Bizionia myxarmorum]TYB76416.1 collagen-like protein [Bizionia myxarmorum]
MKKLLTILFVSALILTSCEGPQGLPGAPGPQGTPGTDGQIEVAPSFEIELDFVASNNFEFFEPYGFTTYASDVTLVYMLWEVNNNQDVWRLLPQTVEFSEGTLVYNFDFTQTNVRFFLDGTVDFNSLDVSWTRNQVFRVVVIPAFNAGKQDFSDLNTVMEAYNITEFEKR